MHKVQAKPLVSREKKLTCLGTKLAEVTITRMLSSLCNTMSFGWWHATPCFFLSFPNAISSGNRGKLEKKLMTTLVFTIPPQQKHPFWHAIELNKCKTPILVYQYTIELSKCKIKIQYLIGVHLIDSKNKSTRYLLKLQKNSTHES
jgi:hypothetical protein